MLAACSRGDVGSPCNHGTVEPPPTQVVTFPALSCDDLLCVYGEDHVVPTNGCQEDIDCNVSAELDLFECVVPAGEQTGSCRLALDYVLERSMCSRPCDTDSDCANGSVGDQVVAGDTTCQTGFACSRLMRLGEFCCEKMCVCRDELPDTTALDEACESGMETCANRRR